MSKLHRREFLEFMGRTLGAATLAGWSGGLSCVTPPKRRSSPFTSLAPTSTDGVELAEGFRYEKLIGYGDSLGRGLRCGADCDFIGVRSLPPRNGQEQAVLWVNHEDFHPLFVSGWQPGQTKTRAQFELERQAVGGSLFRIEKNKKGTWQVRVGDPLNRRFTARTKIPFSSPVRGARNAEGTLANCGGGLTPWGTFLSCEENYHYFVGEIGRPEIQKYNWSSQASMKPEHYGWVVEIDPLQGTAQKLVALGRFAHEGATVTRSLDGRPVVYMGDDAADECLYKFIGDKADSLKTGTLYVASLEKGKWIALDRNQNLELAKLFPDQTELLIQARQAARVVGGTLLDRPEDIEIDRKTGWVYLALTNNKLRGNPHGSLLRFQEENQDPGSLTFRSETFLAGGAKHGFSCPDNLAFDPKGNLWMTSDISGKEIGAPPYEAYGHNSLFYVPLSGENAGEVFRVASAPRDAEFTGPCFSPDGQSLFLSVQHPGETTSDLKNPSSHWPDGGGSLPRSSVIVVSGPALSRLTS